MLFWSLKRGWEKKGPPEISPKSFSQKGPKWCSVLSIGVIGKSALEIGHFLRRNFWVISGGPFLSRPLCFTAEKGFCRGSTWLDDRGTVRRKWTDEVLRRTSRSHPSRPLSSASFQRSGSKGALDFQGRRGIASIVRWNLRRSYSVSIFCN